MARGVDPSVRELQYFDAVEQSTCITSAKGNSSLEWRRPLDENTLIINHVGKCIMCCEGFEEVKGTVQKAVVLTAVLWNLTSSWYSGGPIVTKTSLCAFVFVDIITISCSMAID